MHQKWDPHRRWTGALIDEVFHDESISEDLKTELYWIALWHYSNDASKIFDEEKVESSHLGPGLSPSTPSPPLLTVSTQKRRRYRQRESPPPLLASTTESKRRRRRCESAAKHRTRKPISWEAYWWRQCVVYIKGKGRILMERYLGARLHGKSPWPAALYNL